jgi:hypothetical protein
VKLGDGLLSILQELVFPSFFLDDIMGDNILKLKSCSCVVTCGDEDDDEEDSSCFLEL